MVVPSVELLGRCRHHILAFNDVSRSCLTSIFSANNVRFRCVMSAIYIQFQYYQIFFENIFFRRYKSFISNVLCADIFFRLTVKTGEIGEGGYT